MGAGIAQVACLGGFETRLHDPLPEALEGGIARVGAALAKGAEGGRWSADAATAAAGRLAPAKTLEDLAGCDLVIEAAPEDLALKRELFARLAEACGAETILATNTSSLLVAAMASAVPRPERLVGMHFFNPPALMELVEIVAAPDSAEPALELVTDVASGWAGPRSAPPTAPASSPTASSAPSASRRCGCSATASRPTRRSTAPAGSAAASAWARSS